MKKSELTVLLNKYGLEYIKQLSTNSFKVYDTQLDHNAIVSYGYDKYIGYTIVSYTPVN